MSMLLRLLSTLLDAGVSSVNKALRSSQRKWLKRPTMTSTRSGRGPFQRDISCVIVTVAVDRLAFTVVQGIIRHGRCSLSMRDEFSWCHMRLTYTLRTSRSYTPVAHPHILRQLVASHGVDYGMIVLRFPVYFAFWYSTPPPNTDVVGVEHPAG